MPVMLFSQVVYFDYLQDTGKSLKTSLSENWGIIVAILIANWVCVLLGFCMESAHLEKKTRGVLLSLSWLLFLSYFLLLLTVARKTYEGAVIWYFTFIVWSLYGVAFLLPWEKKNVAYNILDVFSKNVFGFILTISAL
jgi:bacteriorhodopsin